MPAVPTGLRMTSNTGTFIAIAWDDTLSKEMLFETQRRRDNGQWTTGFETGANVTKWNNTGLVCDTSCGCRVRAIDVVGSLAWAGFPQFRTLP